MFLTEGAWKKLLLDDGFILFVFHFFMSFGVLLVLNLQIQKIPFQSPIKLDRYVVTVLSLIVRLATPKSQYPELDFQIFAPALLTICSSD